jgi:hypothetical protein
VLPPVHVTAPEEHFVVSGGMLILETSRAQSPSSSLLIIQSSVGNGGNVTGHVSLCFETDVE